MPNSKKIPLDLRSTGRKRARRALERSNRPYRCACEGCNSPNCKINQGLGIEIRDDYTGNVTTICGFVPGDPQSRSSTLDADHISKNISDNDLANLRYCCRPCHRSSDRETAKGIAKEEVKALTYPSEMFLGLD